MFVYIVIRAASFTGGGITSLTLSLRTDGTCQIASPSPRLRAAAAHRFAMHIDAIESDKEMDRTKGGQSVKGKRVAVNLGLVTRKLRGH